MQIHTICSNVDLNTVEKIEWMNTSIYTRVRSDIDISEIKCITTNDKDGVTNDFDGMLLNNNDSEYHIYHFIISYNSLLTTGPGNLTCQISIKTKTDEVITEPCFHVKKSNGVTFHNKNICFTNIDVNRMGDQSMCTIVSSVSRDQIRNITNPRVVLNYQLDTTGDWKTIEIKLPDDRDDTNPLYIIESIPITEKFDKIRYNVEYFLENQSIFRDDRYNAQYVSTPRELPDIGSLFSGGDGNFNTMLEEVMKTFAAGNDAAGESKGNEGEPTQDEIEKLMSMFTTMLSKISDKLEK